MDELRLAERTGRLGGLKGCSEVGHLAAFLRPHSGADPQSPHGPLTATTPVWLTDATSQPPHAKLFEILAELKGTSARYFEAKNQHRSFLSSATEASSKRLGSRPSPSSTSLENWSDERY